MEKLIVDRLLTVSNGALLMNSKQLAKVLGLHPTTICELKNNGDLGIPSVVGVGKRDMFSVVEVAKFLFGQSLTSSATIEYPTVFPRKPTKKIRSGLPTCAELRALSLNRSQHKI